MTNVLTQCECGRPAGPRGVCVDCLDSLAGKTAFPAPITSIVIEPPNAPEIHHTWYARCGDKTESGISFSESDARKQGTEWIERQRKRL